jgi:transposase InsO family protein
VLRRHGCSQRRRAGARQTTRRYEWAQPGALLHIDTMQLPKFERPGHWATSGQRSEQIRTRGAGTVYVISVVDDHSRLAYCELHSGEDRWSTTATLRRAAAWMTEQGCGPLEAVMSDNHKAYTSHRFQHLLAQLGARHITTPPYTPRWNGKVCVLASSCRPVGRRGSPRPGGLTQAKGMLGWVGVSEPGWLRVPFPVP